KNYALIIGVKEYQSPNVNDLANPISDATRLARVLLEKYNFREKEMVFLQNPTRMQIITALDLLAGVVTPIDNLLIFYAGHGLWDEQFKKGYWIPSDASPDNRSNWFSNSALRDYVGGIRSHHTLLITDACFGGGIFRTREAFSDVTQATFELYKLPSRKAMTSGAMTTVPDRSVFIEYLLKRLAENNNPYLSSEQLFASFKIAVINNSATNQVPQFGEIRETGDEGGDFLFILK
ncbi:MAG: caspase family protein, partial [Bacteroidales bacterium]|nr:caspase family protein [Bacteroidales bacterium]